MENYVGKLQEFCVKNKIPAPTYEVNVSFNFKHFEQDLFDPLIYSYFH